MKFMNFILISRSSMSRVLRVIFLDFIVLVLFVFIVINVRCELK